MLLFHPGGVSGHSVAIAQLAGALSNRTGTGDIDRPVIDRTGLTGAFDIDLQWTPLSTGATNGPTLFTALQEQLGLRLERSTAPLEVRVLDSVERPTAN